MYIPKHFEVNEKEEIFSFIEANSFGQLISQVNGRPFSTHMPFLLDSNHQILSGHMAKQNPQHLTIVGQEVLVSLQGPHAYISPSWYISPGVPTWNYQSVHIYGICRIIDDRQKIKELVETLAGKHEATFTEPWKTEYRTEMLNAIIGIEIEIKEIQGKFKLSQNRSEEDQRNLFEQLLANGETALAEAMKRNTL